MTLNAKSYSNASTAIGGNTTPLHKNHVDPSDIRITKGNQVTPNDNVSDLSDKNLKIAEKAEASSFCSKLCVIF